MAKTSLPETQHQLTLHDNSPASIHRLAPLQEAGIAKIDELPFSIRVLLESALRNRDGFLVTEQNVLDIARWSPKGERGEIPFIPARVILQDFTGVPAVVDLAACRDAVVELKGDATKVNPAVDVDLVIDHSVQVDVDGRHADALAQNLEIEYQRNTERYGFLKWGQENLENFGAVPPGRGIVHQVNLEYLAKLAMRREKDGTTWLFPDSLVGTDSHTTMINGMAVLGWGVGGIEAEAVMLGQPIYMLLPDVVGFRLEGKLAAGVTATDLTLQVVEMLREKKVVGKFVEFYGPGLDALSLSDRATIANMAPEYGATCGFFPADKLTLDYMRLTGRDEGHISDVEQALRQQSLFRTSETPEPKFTDTLSLDIGTVKPSMAGPKRPQDRVALDEMKSHFKKSLTEKLGLFGHGVAADNLDREVPVKDSDYSLTHGDVVIAAITSCTNTSNPAVMVAAGILAKKAVERGLNTKPWVKTSLAPGSRVVTEYFDDAGLTEPLAKIGFHTVGYGCTTCIGNSGPLPAAIDAAIVEGKLVAGSVISGNRNFEGRVHNNVKASYLASPPLVVAYAIAGTLDIDFDKDPIAQDQDGKDVMLSELWPSQEEVQAVLSATLKPKLFSVQYETVTKEPRWDSIEVAQSALYPWDSKSTYIQQPPFFSGLSPKPEAISSISGARVLLKLGDSVTTDHISPAGAIPEDGPAGQYLKANGVAKRDFNSFGSRRGNHEVMMRGTFANVRIRNQIAPGTEGGYTTYWPDNRVEFIYDAAMKYIDQKTPLVVLAGEQYGTGSSRDWAAKGTLLLGVKAVISKSFERIHRSNLVGMGVLPLCFKAGEGAESLGLTGEESFDIPLTDAIQPLQEITVTARRPDGSELTFPATVRLDTPVEVEYYRNGGILHTVIRKLAS